MSERKLIVYAMICGFVLGVVVMFGIQPISVAINNTSDRPLQNGFGSTWSCMDGCYNMLEVIYKNVSYDNQTQHDFHNQCAEMCFEQKW